ncbi:MAG TPA: cytochrome c oxidase assembly protein [Thermoleophilaceae bacterium]|nr:cytochrome c oxidase assembly protein [Thermoleophilaceae bacterium]
MPFTVEPGAIAFLALLGVLYARAVATLRRRGYAVPAGQQAAWWTGIALTAAGLTGPVDALSDDLVLAHMGQHLLIADLAAPFLLIGMRSPVYAFFLPRPLLVTLARRRRLRRVFRVLRRPWVAVPVWVVILYGWHFSFTFVAALENPLLHVAQHMSFLFGAVLVWWSVVEPKRRRLPGDLWKVPYLLGARISGMFLGMALILLRSPAYADYYGDRARDHGLSPLTDQQVAGGMMLGLDLVVMLFAVSFFFYRSAQEHDRAERTAAAA